MLESYEILFAQVWAFTQGFHSIPAALKYLLTTSSNSASPKESNAAKVPLLWGLDSRGRANKQQEKRQITSIQTGRNVSWSRTSDHQAWVGGKQLQERSKSEAGVGGRTQWPADPNVPFPSLSADLCPFPETSWVYSSWILFSHKVPIHMKSRSWTLVEHSHC